MKQPDYAAALRHLRRTDPRLRGIIDRAGPPRFRGHQSTFQFLARAIIFQQLSGKAAQTIYSRFLALFSHRRFPKPDEVWAVPVESLREVGLSRQKATYLHDLAEKLTDGTVRPRVLGRLSDEDIAAQLTQVKGIGQWTVDMFLIFFLKRPDVLPVGDLGVQKGLRLLYELDDLPDAETMLRLAEPWRPYRSIASWYLWRVLETELPG